MRGRVRFFPISHYPIPIGYTAHSHSAQSNTLSLEMKNPFLKSRGHMLGEKKVCKFALENNFLAISTEIIFFLKTLNKYMLVMINIKYEKLGTSVRLFTFL